MLARLTEARPRARSLERGRDRLTSLTVELAGATLDGQRGQLEGLSDRVRSVSAWARTAPVGLRESVLRLPSCFRSFDQRPQDVEQLVVRFARRWPDRRRPVVVVGIRTSGSYLGPLCSSALRRAGFADVASMSVRPGVALGRWERQSLRDVIHRQGLVVIVDDPPASGSSIDTVASGVIRAGVASDSVVLLLALVDADGRLPDRLARYPSVTLGWDEWYVHRQLEPVVVQRSLQELMAPTLRLQALRPAANLTLSSGRGHIMRRYTADFTDARSGVRWSTTIVVEGSGLGLFGRHAVAVAGALTSWVPATFGFADGLVYRTWVAGETLRRSGMSSHTAAIADYVADRQAALPAGADRSVALGGSQPAWEVVANAVRPALGRAGLPLRMPVIDPIVRRALRVAEPSIVDGRMGPGNWVTPDSNAGIVKLASADGAFSSRDLFSYDAIFDLAGAGVAVGADALPLLRERYETVTGQRVPEERWALYQLAHLWDARRAGSMGTSAAARAGARALQRYFAAVYLSDMTISDAGRFCAIDIDGVLEIDPLGFPATTELGARSLRALVAHGFRPVLASGRCTADVVDRCESYGLPGGVAEYGAVVFDGTSGAVIDTCGDPQLEVIAAVREHLDKLPGVHVDPSYTRTVRAYRVDRHRRRSLPAPLVQAVVDGFEGQVAAIDGQAQTDFTAVGVTKGRGLLRLLEELEPLASGCRSGPPLALAVGDGVADLAMFDLAERVAAPSHAPRGVKRRCRVRTRGSYARGLASGVGQLLGHPPGGCSLCAVPGLAPDTRRLVRILSVLEAGPSGIPRRLAVLGADALRARMER